MSLSLGRVWHEGPTVSGGTEMGESWVLVVTRLGCSGVLSEGRTCCGEGGDGAGAFGGSFLAGGPTTRARHSSGARELMLVGFRTKKGDYVLNTDIANLVKSSTVQPYAVLLKSGHVALMRVVVSPKW